jgi:hypothetical protein
MVKTFILQNEEGDLIKTYRYRSSDPLCLFWRLNLMVLVYGNLLSL